MKAAVLWGALCTCACGTSFDHVEYSPIGGVPTGALLEPNSVTVPIGESVAARVVAVDDHGSTMPCDPALVSDNQAVMTVERAERGSTVFTGITTGETTIVVHCAGEDGVITGRVTKSAN